MLTEFGCSAVAVKWLDHTASIGSWHGESMIYPSCLSSLGYVVRDEDDYIVLAESLAHDDNFLRYGHERAILKSCIVEMKVLNATLSV